MKPGAPYDEVALLRLISEGDAIAFRQLFERHKGKVYYIAREMLHSDEAAQDAVQEIFLKIWLHNQRLAGINNFTAYLNTITRNHIYNVLRKEAGQEKLLRHLLQQEVITGEGEALNTLALHEMQRILHDAIGILSPQQRKVFEMSRLEGLKQDEIAASLGLSKETVKKYLADALRKLKSQLGPHSLSLVLILLLQLG